jgi:DNA polymerase III psi subunit
MNLSDSQLVALREIGIPIWEYRIDDAQKAFKQQEPDTVSERLNKQNASDTTHTIDASYLVVVESTQLDTQAHTLLRGITKALDVSASDIKIVNATQIKQLDITDINRYFLVLGQEALLSLDKGYDYQSMANQIHEHDYTMLVSHSLSDMLSSSSLKEDIWKLMLQLKEMINVHD